MKDVMEYLEKDPLHYADMLDNLRDKRTSVVYSEEDGVLLRLDMGTEPAYFLTAKTGEVAKKLVKMIKEKEYIILAHEFRFVSDIFDVTGILEMLPCRQASYQSEKPFEIEPAAGIEFKPLKKEHLKFVMENYSSAESEEYIKSRIEKGMIGAFKGESCVGFIGEHGEGSMGLLEVLPEYRRSGIGSVLGKMMINRKLKEGRIPYDHIVIGNDPSMQMQKSMGMSISDSMVVWLFND